MTMIMMILYLFLAGFLFLFLIKHKKKSQGRLPPGPKGLPLIGNIHQIGNPIHKSLQLLANEYGDLMFLRLGSVPTLVVSSADAVRDIFKAHDLVFSGRPGTYTVKKFSYNYSNISFAPYGEFWREVRKIAILELLSPKRVQSFQAVREEEVANVLDSIARASGSIDLNNLMTVLSNTVLCRVAFGKKYYGGSDGKISVQEMLQEEQGLAGGIFISDFFPSLEWLNKFNGLDARLEKTFQQLDSVYNRVLKEHLDPKRPKPEHEDLVDVMLRLQNDPTQAITISNDAIKGVLQDMFIAGTDTSAATLTWTMTELIRNPAVMKRAQEEVRRLVKGNKVDESDLPRLEYLKLVIKESFRLHLPAPLLVPRETIEDCTIRGYVIPAKTRVFINATSISLDPKTWEDPHEFQPERFLDSPVDFRGQHFELIPFGVGRRGCPGIHFASLLVELALANMLLRFDWELPPGMRVQDVDMEEAPGITMHKKIPLCLVATPAALLA